MDNQQPSTSSSSSGQQQKIAKIENKQVEKRLKEKSKSESENQVEVEGECFVDQLPPEMLTEIFKYLDVKSLVNSRLVSRKWNGVAREVLKSSDDVQIVFYCKKSKDGNLKLEGKPQSTSLGSFIKYFKDSREFPLYTRFRFVDFEPLVFDHPDWIKFARDFGKSVKSLRLEVPEKWTLNEERRLVVELKKVLLNQLPNVSEVGLQFAYFNFWARGTFHTAAFSSLQPFETLSLPFKLNKLCLWVSNIYNTEAFWSDASILISSLLESSKDILTELKIDSLGFLPDLHLPKFSKLTKLTILKNKYFWLENQILPSGINLLETFPVLKFLKLQVPWTGFVPDDENPNVSQLPSLESLEITGREMRKEDIERISQVCLNLKELSICSGKFKGSIENFPEFGKAIWTHLTKLESLNLQIDMNKSANNISAVDSTFTGFSRRDCIRLYNLIKKNEQSAEKQGSQLKTESKSLLDAERKNPSILDLKDLKRLQVHCFISNQVSIQKWLSVSEECAFKRMENLDYELK